MAQTDELVAQAMAADTTDQLDAIQAASQDPAVIQAVQQRRAELNARSVTPGRAPDGGLGPNATTEPDKRQYFNVPNGDGTFRQVNAWGEEKGSAEDKKRAGKDSAAQ